VKKTTVPSLPIDCAIRTAGASLSGFMLEVVRLNIKRRERQKSFVARGLLARGEICVSGEYVSAEAMLARLDESLATARNRQAAKTK